MHISVLGQITQLGHRCAWDDGTCWTRSLRLSVRCPRSNINVCPNMKDYIWYFYLYYCPSFQKCWLRL